MTYLKNMNLLSTFLLLIVTLTQSNALMTGTGPAYSNINRISYLQSIQKTQLSNPIESSTGGGPILEYNTCIQREQEKLKKSDIFGPYYLFGVEDIEINLSCGPCIPKGYPISWSKLTFENFQTEVKKTDSHSPNITEDLTLTFPKPDMSTYYCSWISRNKVEFIMNIWTVEIVAVDDLEQVFTRRWVKPRDFKTAEMIVKYTWSTAWSNCNKCDTAGKRHRFGYCSVNKNTISKSKSVEWKALEVYSFLSCSLFLNLHPEIGGMDQELTQHLASSPKIMVGYCKTPCEEMDFNPEDEFLKTYSQSLRLLYKSGSGGFNNETETLEAFAKENLRKMNFFQLVLGFKDIPITTDYIPEILAILSLIGLQVFILVQVCKNRVKAR